MSNVFVSCAFMSPSITNSRATPPTIYPTINWNRRAVVLEKRAESSPPSYYDTHVLTHSWHLANLLWMKSEPIQPCIVLKPQKTWKCQSSWMQNLWIDFFFQLLCISFQCWYFIFALTTYCTVLSTAKWNKKGGFIAENVSNTCSGSLFWASTWGKRQAFESCPSIRVDFLTAAIR